MMQNSFSSSKFHVTQLCVAIVLAMFILHTIY